MLAPRRSSVVKTTGLLLFGALSLVAYGCGSSSNNSGKKTVSCATKPSDCKAGTTCWVADTNGNYACLPAKVGAGKGTSCTNVVGQPQCDEHLGCFPGQSGSAKGTCMPFCDNGGCLADEMCEKVILLGVNSPPISMCGPLPNDGGSDSGPPGDAGQDTGSDAASNNDAATESGGDAASNSDAGSSDAAGG